MRAAWILAAALAWPLGATAQAEGPSADAPPADGRGARASAADQSGDGGQPADVPDAGAPPPGVPLVNAADWQLVYANCAGCHSLRLVTSQRGDRATWLALIRWMQETQNLWTLAPDVESRILDYLAENYAPGGPSRRAQLPAHLLPPRR